MDHATASACPLCPGSRLCTFPVVEHSRVKLSPVSARLLVHPLRNGERRLVAMVFLSCLHFSRTRGSPQPHRIWTPGPLATRTVWSSQRSCRAEAHRI